MQDNEPPDTRSNRNVVFLLVITIITLFFLFNDLIRWIGGAGIFSVVSAMKAVLAKARVIAVDGSGLRILFVAGCSIAATAIGLRFSIDMKRRRTFVFFMLSIIGGGFVLDAICGPTIIKHLLADHGYSRCTTRDYVRGTGKGRVWFDVYVSNAVDCPAKRPTK